MVDWNKVGRLFYNPDGKAQLDQVRRDARNERNALKARHDQEKFERDLPKLERKFGVRIEGDYIVHSHHSVALAGAEVTVDTAGAIENRLRGFVGVGGFGLLLKKRTDRRELYIAVSGPDGAFVAPVDPDKGQQAREYAAYLNTRSRQAAQDGDDQ